jgi:hypothetical protein
VLADISGVDLDTGTIGWRNYQIGALLTRLACSVADEQRQPGVRLTFQQLAHQLHSEKAGRTGDKDKLFAIHAETDLSARTTRRPVNDDLSVPGRRGKLCFIINRRPRLESATDIVLSKSMR